MLLQVDPRTLGENFFLILSALILLGLGGVVVLAIRIGVKLWLQSSLERKSWEKHQAERLGPDGKPHPPYIEGICQACNRGDHRVYHLDSGEALCRLCYEAFCLARAGHTTKASGDD